MLLYPPLLMLALYLTLFIITTFSSGILTLDLLLALVSFILMIKIANNLSGSLGQAVSKFATGAVKTLTLAAAGGAVGYGLRSGFGAIAGKIKGSK
ncbi:MAG: hypothetical protein ORN26_00095 [Candidatus Pacebacteria bacterium]|nr:hypothetical protein [Candidatus Paceibacterota bacterium]